VTTAAYINCDVVGFAEVGGPTGVLDPAHGAVDMDAIVLTDRADARSDRLNNAPARALEKVTDG